MASAKALVAPKSRVFFGRGFWNVGCGLWDMGYGLWGLGTLGFGFFGVVPGVVLGWFMAQVLACRRRLCRTALLIATKRVVEGAAGTGG